MIQRILVATDGSPLSNHAVRSAAHLAAALGAELVGFTVTDEYPVSPLADYAPVGTPSREAFDAEQARIARARLGVVEAAAAAVGVKHEVDFKPGLHVWKLIIEAARTKHCHLIVMASQGHTTLGRTVLGSETNKVLTHCAIPLMVCRADRASEPHFKHVLVPTDGSPLSHAAARDAAALASALGAQLTALCVEQELPSPLYGEGVPLPNPDVEDFRKRQAVWSSRALADVAQIADAARVACRVETRVSDRPAEAIASAAQECGCDLIFMASHGRRGVTALVLGSVTNKVLAQTHLPVWVHRAPK